MKPGQQHPRTFEKRIKKTVGCKYVLFLPDGYGKAEQKWPLLMFLHGAGERGKDLRLVKKHGPPRFLDRKTDFGFIVVSPQCPNDVWWPEKLDVLINLLDEVESLYEVDTERVYLTGLSMGGFGTWSLACAYPERFAAIAPICGGGEKYLADRLKDVPVWAFHGAKDDTVPLARSEEMVEAVKQKGGDAKLTVYPEAAHDSWTRTYENPGLYDWFLKHRITDRGK